MMDNSFASTTDISITSSTTSSTTYNRAIKLLIIGDSGVGKTCLLMRYCNESFNPTYLTTIGIDFKVKMLPVGNENIKLQIWDTAGQERFRTLTKSYYRGMEGIVLVYDVTDRRSFDSIRNWISTIEEHTNSNNKKKRYNMKKNKDGNNVSVNKILIGNKCDMKSSSSSSSSNNNNDNPNHNFVTTEEGQKLAEEFNMKFYECSAKDNINVDECFMSITKDIVQRLPSNSNDDYSLNKSKNNNNIIILGKKKKNNNNNASNRRNCC